VNGDGETGKEKQEKFDMEIRAGEGYIEKRDPHRKVADLEVCGSAMRRIPLLVGGENSPD